MDSMCCKKEQLSVATYTSSTYILVFVHRANLLLTNTKKDYALTFNAKDSLRGRRVV